MAELYGLYMGVILTTSNDLDLFFSSVFCLRKNHGMKITIKKTHRLGEYVWLELFPEHLTNKSMAAVGDRGCLFGS